MTTLAVSEAPRVVPPAPRCLLEEHLDLVQRRLDALVRRRCPHWEEAEEFRSWCLLKLLDNDCHILRSFRGQSSLSTFLTTVIQRLFLDFRDHRWGRYRPCAAARRVGPDGVLLERLLVRDGFSLDEALRWITAHHAESIDEEVLRQLAAQLPIRARMHRPQDLEAARTYAAPERTDDAVFEHEDNTRRQQILLALHHAVAELPEKDRALLRMRFEEGAPMPEVARQLGEDAKPLYRQVYRLLSQLRSNLRAVGVQPNEVAMLFN